MPRIVDHDARRRSLLDRAFVLFAEQGVNGLSMRDLARGLGVSTGTLYHYFESKEALFEGAFLHLTERLVGLATADLEGVEPRDRMASLVAFLSDHHPVLQQALRLALDHQRSSPDGQAMLTRVLTLYHAVLVEHFAVPDDRATRVMSYVLGVLVHSTLDPPGVDVPAQLAILLDDQRLRPNSTQSGR